MPWNSWPPYIPNKYKHTVLYFGWYAQAAVGKRKKTGPLTAGKPVFFHQVEDDNKARKYRWAQLITVKQYCFAVKKSMPIPCYAQIAADK